MSVNKYVIIINGKWGVGKDTVMDITDTVWKTVKISSITPIKEAAKILGWNGVKDLPDRKFLSDLKKLSTNYNDFPTEYLVREYQKFLEDPEMQILFVCIRERENIDKFKERIGGKCTTILIQRDGIPAEYGNHSDDDVEDYFYDFRFYNITPLGPLMKESVLEFFAKVIYHMKQAGLCANVDTSCRTE